MPIFFAVIVGVIALDQASKWWIMHHFLLWESRELIPHLFNLTYMTNNGAAFSMLAGQPAQRRQYFFLALTVVALVCIVIAQRGYGRRSSWYTVALGLIAGGALGNMIDRIHFGFVVDFLDVYVRLYHWPAFNVADSAITVGVILFIVKNLLFDHD